MPRMNSRLANTVPDEGVCLPCSGCTVANSLCSGGIFAVAPIGLEEAASIQAAGVSRASRRLRIYERNDVSASFYAQIGNGPGCIEFKSCAATLASTRRTANLAMSVA